MKKIALFVFIALVGGSASAMVQSNEAPPVVPLERGMAPDVIPPKAPPEAAPASKETAAQGEPSVPASKPAEAAPVIAAAKSPDATVIKLEKQIRLNMVARADAEGRLAQAQKDLAAVINLRNQFVQIDQQRAALAKHVQTIVELKQEKAAALISLQEANARIEQMRTLTTGVKTTNVVSFLSFLVAVVLMCFLIVVHYRQKIRRIETRETRSVEEDRRLIERRDTTITSLENNRTMLGKAIANLESDIAKLNKSIANKDAEILELVAHVKESDRKLEEANSRLEGRAPEPSSNPS